MASMKSAALESTALDLDGLGFGQRVLRLLPVYGLLILMLALVALFSVLLPDTFPTMLNVRSILGDKSIIAILAPGRSLAAMVPMMAGCIDLTVSYGIVLWHILAIALQTQYGIDWRVAVVIVLLLGCLLGFANGLFVEMAQIDSFIATLGTGTVLYATALWYTGGRQVIGRIPREFTALFTTQFLGLPVAALYVLVISVVLWAAAEYLPVGRYLCAIGANQRAAALNGIPTRRYVIGAFVVSLFQRVKLRSASAARRHRGSLAGGATAHRPGERRARVSASRARWRVPRLDDHPARALERLGHGRGCRHPGSGHLRHPAIRRRVLR